MSVPYTTAASIEQKISQPDLIAALDDGLSGGNLNTTALNQIILDASSEVDGMVSSIYAVPFIGYIPPAISSAALYIACEQIYAKRLAPGDKNPFTAVAKMKREWLVKVGSGDIPLDQNTTRAVQPVTAFTSCMAMDANTQ